MTGKELVSKDWFSGVAGFMVSTALEKKTARRFSVKLAIAGTSLFVFGYLASYIPIAIRLYAYVILVGSIVLAVGFIFFIVTESIRMTLSRFPDSD